MSPSGMAGRSDFDGDVHARREVELLKLVHGLGGGIENVDEALVGALLEALHRLLVGMRRPVDGHALDVRGERDGTGDAGSGAFNGLDDFTRRGVNHPVVVGLEANANALSSHTK